MPSNQLEAHIRIVKRLILMPQNPSCPLPLHSLSIRVENLVFFCDEALCFAGGGCLDEDVERHGSLRTIFVVKAVEDLIDGHGLAQMADVEEG